MIALRDEGLIAGIGLSNVSPEQLVHAVRETEIVCVQNPMNLLERESMPVLRECQELGIAFVPFFPLGSAFGGVNRLLTHPDVIASRTRLAATPAQVALAWLLELAPNVLLIPGTSTLAHLHREPDDRPGPPGRRRPQDPRHDQRLSPARRVGDC